MSHLTSVVGTNAVRVEGFEDGKYHAKTTFFDDDALEHNKKIRNSGMLEKSALGLHDNADVRMAISCPSTTQWMYFKSKHYETYKLLTSQTSEEDRMKGARQLQLLHPDWVVFERL